MVLIRKALAVPALAVALSAPAAGQTPPPAPIGIQDNSFLLEEAYNQEAGVVQTIQTFTRVSGTGDWVYALTQEWPVPDQKNQLSATIQFLGLSGPGGSTRGFGDVQLNYRYQLVGSSEAAVAVAPRATLVIPSGSSKRGLGSGGLGLQIGLPLSVVLSRSFVSNTNLGATILFGAKSADGVKSDLRGGSAGQSLIWLVHPNVNVLVEAVVATAEVFGADGAPGWRTEALVSPGLRGAINLPGHLQIVPGFAVPLGVGPSHGKNAILVYLSVELPVF
ncbi:MAG TPA: transporter [Thermoanaerobaculia bacterium]|nr:transporter [Thermoanaerobaculia bacterium]